MKHVQPASPIDRSALAKLLDERIPDIVSFGYEELDRLTTAILALVRPVEGIVLDGEIGRHRGLLAHDVRIAAEALDGAEFGAQARAQRLRTLADHLDGLS